MASYYVEGRRLFVELDCEIDHHCVEQLQKELEKHMAVSMCKSMVFDFSNVQFMDSSGIGLVMWGYKKTVPLGGNVELCHVPDRCDRVFRVSGVYRWIRKE